MVSEPILEAHELRKSHGNQRVLDGISLRVDTGAVVALLGSNGAGKTTLVRILSTLARADAGTATIGALDVARQPKEVRKIISLTGQNAAIDELLTGSENLRLAARLWKLDTSTAQSRINDLLERFELTGAARKQVKTYSGGMKRKLDLAMSLMGSPRVLFLDEPTTGLDPRSRYALWETVREMAAEGISVLLTTQYLEEADRITMIDNGRVIAEGSTDELKHQVARNVVELWFADNDVHARAYEALRAHPGLLPSDAGSLKVTTDSNASSVYSPLETLAQASLSVERIAVHQPTLDDVFLSLTRAHAPRPEVHA